MPTLEQFLRTGHLGPVILGMTPIAVMTAVGDPDDTSLKSNPLQLKYGSAQFSFWRSPKDRQQELREIALIYQPLFRPLPPTLKFTDWNPKSPPTEKRFRKFINGIAYAPATSVKGPNGTQMVFLSGVTAQFTNGRLDNIRLFQRQTKEATSSVLTGEREPTRTEILEMFEEANRAQEIGAYRAGVLIAWAGLEATLRRTAIQTGKVGKIGIQPAILIRELFAAGALTAQDHRTLEELRQLRTGLAHGLAPIGFDATTIQKITTLSRRLLEADHQLNAS
jgi:hypothetical protein